LEHLLEVGITKIIRAGGSSRSPALEGKNLRIVTKSETKTRAESRILGETYSKLEYKADNINSNLRTASDIRMKSRLEALETFLKERYPVLRSQISLYDSEGYKTVGKNAMRVWLGTKADLRKERVDDTAQPVVQVPREAEDILHQARRDIYSLKYAERQQLKEHWEKEAHEFYDDNIFEGVKDAESLRAQITSVHDEVDRRVLESADVIGITTTGLARRIDVLKRVGCKVIICEEAGEVMEPHVLAAILPGVEHFIQIGDHQQLRPQINDFSLSLESSKGAQYQLDGSQFERLSVGEQASGRPPFPLAQLSVQRRMRPEISKLIRTTVYPSLVDHARTLALDDVVGLRKNLFWLHHEHTEDQEKDTDLKRSKSNIWEVDFVQALVRHIVRQGIYKSSDIAVLTPYTGQLQKLRIALRSSFEIFLSDRDEDSLAKDGFEADEDLETKNGKDSTSPIQRPLTKKTLGELLRLATVDNFQGEEAKIIIVSLVRSNSAKKVGFLRTENRINVLLSRAQHGMYLVGNTETYHHIPMWAQVLGMLKATDSTGPGLDLCCPRHTETQIRVSEPEDFLRLSPEGGCSLPCDRRLSHCGHRCLAKCHSDSMHDVFSCPQPCVRLHEPCKHACQKATCGENCGPCMVPISGVMLPCGHVVDKVSCYRTRDVSAIYCHTIVEKTVPNCQHVVSVPCHRDVSSESFECPVACIDVLSCRHQCPGTCAKCSKGKGENREIQHQPCTKICGLEYGTCNHSCPKRCHDGKECSQCISVCEVRHSIGSFINVRTDTDRSRNKQVRCSHSKCTLTCHQPCTPCIEPCKWSCSHRGACTLPCGAPCNRLPCNQRCDKLLGCGHQCPGLCGEECRDGYCHICSKKGDSRVDFLEMKTYDEIDPNESPIVVLGCGHFFTAESLDGMIGMQNVYAANTEGDYTALVDISNSLADGSPRCPDCRRVIRQHVTRRYGRVINRAVLDEMTKRFLLAGLAELQKLELQIDAVEERLSKSRDDIQIGIEAYKQGHATPLMNLKGMETRTIIIKSQLQRRYIDANTLNQNVRNLRKKTSAKHQPAQKLHQAVIRATKKESLEGLIADLKLNEEENRKLPVENQVSLGGQHAQLRIKYLIIADQLQLYTMLSSITEFEYLQDQRTNYDKDAVSFLRECQTFMTQCREESLPKLAIRACVYHAIITQHYAPMILHSKEANITAERKRLIADAFEMLTSAEMMCKDGFEGSKDMLEAIKQTQDTLKRLDRYEPISPAELESIKAAMVSGRGGINTHSGHWYNCENGHPFAIGECGMPMELAQCPECGARIGGEQHRAVGGVTRATDMET
jgi:hypothetical protein